MSTTNGIDNYRKLNDKEFTLYELVYSYIITEFGLTVSLDEKKFNSLCSKVASGIYTFEQVKNELNRIIIKKTVTIVDSNFITEAYPTNQFIMYMQQSLRNKQDESYNSVSIALTRSKGVSDKVISDIAYFLINFPGAYQCIFTNTRDLT